MIRSDFSSPGQAHEHRLRPRLSLPFLRVSPCSSPRKRHRRISDEPDHPSSESERSAPKLNLGEPRPSPSLRQRMDASDEWELERANARAGNAWQYGVPSMPPPPGSMRSFAIERDHPLIPLWPSMREAIEAALERSTIRWHALEVYRRRQYLESNGLKDTTILITADRDDDEGWHALERRVREIVVAHGHGWLQVELIEGVVERLISRQENLYEPTPKMGSSLSVVGCDWAGGTLGGYLEICPPGADPIRCALTCHHVLRPSRPPGYGSSSGQEASPYDPVLDQVGAHHPTIRTPDEELQIDSPSFRDHQQQIESLDSIREGFKKDIAKIEALIQQGCMSNSLLQRLDRSRKMHAEYQELYTQASAFDRELGSVQATSGYRVARGGHILDWGLVRVKASRAGRNELSTKPPSVPKDLGEQLVLDGVKRTGSLALRERVVMIGKSSGAVVGEVSHIDSRVRPPGLDRITTEFVVCGTNGSKFTVPGDSGAFVLDTEGALVGLLWGGPRGKGHDGNGYVTPITEVLRDIEHQTGAKVTLDF